MDNSKLLTEEKLHIIREKQANLPTIMREEGIDCWLIFVRETSSNPDPIQSLTIGGDVVWISAFIYTLNEDKLHTTAIVGDFDVIAERGKDIWNEVIGYTEGISAILIQHFSELDPKVIALNYSETDVVADGLSHGLFKIVSKILELFQSRFVSSEGLIRKLRGVKSPTELTFIKQACDITAKINTEMSQKLAPGMTEVEIQKEFQIQMEKHGVSEAWQLDQCPMVDAGPEKEMGHSGPLATLQTQLGHTLHNDFGVRYHGYCSDIQRLWFFGTSANLPKELRYAFDTVREAIHLASKFIKPGVQGHEVDSIAREYVVSLGYKEFGHALGHQVGIEAHDGGTILGPLWERYGNSPRGIISINNVFTLELHVVTENYGTVSLEEMIKITPGGCEFFLPPQQDFWYVSSST
ncbi:MAG: M24 family metallopeptidase [Promethearchaeota archaeon]